jgi:NADH-quinone oxidoreductase subunit N
MNHLELLNTVLPEAIVATAAFVALLADLSLLRSRSLRTRRAVAVALAGAGCVAAGLCLFRVSGPVVLCDGMFVVDPLTQWIKLTLLVLTAGTGLLLLDTDFTAHVGEFVGLLLLATVAMMFLVSAQDLLMLFLSLEMISLCLYVMTAFHKQSGQSAEAALKYFLFGGICAAVMLFGLSLIYGVTGHTSLPNIAAQLRIASLEPVFYLGLVMTVTGLGFKIAAVPFHLWAPDTYQGAPIPSAAFIASGSKVASFIVLARLLNVGFDPARGSASWNDYAPGWVPLIAALAVLSILLGNLAALAQRSVRRLLAFSAVAHAGYMLIGLLAGNPDGAASLFYYAVTYGLTLVGAFGVVGVVQQQRGRDALEDFAGLSRHEPLLATCFLVFILSLAGIPPLAGFFGKFYLFTAALKTHPATLGLFWIVLLALAMSVVSLYYYLQILKQAWVAEPPAGTAPLGAPRAMKWTVAVLAGAVVLLGCLPNRALEILHHALKAAGW